MFKSSVCVFQKPLMTAMVLSAVPALVSLSIVVVFTWTVFSCLTCLCIPTPTWAWQPLVCISWWVCLITGALLALLLLLSLICGDDVRSRVLNFLKAIAICALVACVSAAMYLLLCLGGDSSGSRERYAGWDELKNDKLLIQLVPRSATNIKRRDWGGFRVYQCDVSCSVSLKGFEEFAKERGYLFKPIDSDEALKSGLLDCADQHENRPLGEIYKAAFSEGRFLRCHFFRKLPDGMTQIFDFLYDRVCEKLYCRYSDG